MKSFQCEKQGHAHRFCPVLISTIEPEGASHFKVCSNGKWVQVLHDRMWPGTHGESVVSEKSDHTGESQIIAMADSTRKEVLVVMSQLNLNTSRDVHRLCLTGCVTDAIMSRQYEPGIQNPSG